MKILVKAFASALLLTAVNHSAVAVEKEVKFNKEIKPILKRSCYMCHNSRKKKAAANLRLDNVKSIEEAGFVVAGDSAGSSLYDRITRAEDQKGVMPPTGKRPALSTDEKELIKKWINEGAKF